MNFERLKHSYAVARKMVEVGQEEKLADKKIEELFVLGLNHDIGYDLLEILLSIILLVETY